jgi:FkbM family methyltransferase
MANKRSAGGRLAEAAVRLANRTGFDVTRDHFKHRFLYALAQHQVNTVIDVGANSGQFGKKLRGAGFSGRIHSVEPLAEPYSQLRAAAARDARWTTQQAAVAATAGSITVNVSANSVSSSVLPILERSTEAAPQTGYVATAEVAATTVDDSVTSLGLRPDRSLLKVDVQGYEQQVLDGAAKSLDRFAAVRIELSLVELYGGQTLMPELVDHLSARGFDLWLVEPGFADPRTRRLQQHDGVFFRHASS